MSPGSIEDRWTQLLISEEATVKEALAAIDLGGVEIALLVDGEKKLLGTVTDGDIRRALLKGATLESPVMPFASDHPFVAEPEASRADVLDVMRARRLSQIPIVDDHGRVVGLHVMQELLGGLERPNWAVVMAGGRGDRLGDLTNHLPKPMLKVAGRPILERIVLHLVGSGIKKIFISVNYLAEAIESHFGDGKEFGCQIEYLREDEPLGTAGSLSLLATSGRTPVSPVLVMNGDLVTDFSVEGLFTAHAKSGAAATVAVHEYVHTIPFGVANISEGQLLGIDEKPVERWTVNAGIYVLDPELIARIPTEVPISVTALIQAVIDRGDPVAAWQTSSDWQDIGRPTDLYRARGEQP